MHIFDTSIFDLLAMTGGLALFLYGMQLLSESLTKLSGGRLISTLKSLTSGRLRAVLLGAGVTAVIQSSSATTVMVVGLVNSGMMTLSQAVGVIMGANIGTTVTSWLLSLANIESSNVLLQFARPTAFSPVLSIIGVFLLLFVKEGKKRDVGSALVGFSILITGMDTMTQAIKPLCAAPHFARILTLLGHPLSGLAAGILLTAVMQSSSASVGILQALSNTGSITYVAALPVVLGQNIGTCATAMLSCIGTCKNAKRAAVIHLLFNVIGAAVFMTMFYTVNTVFPLSFLRCQADSTGIALIHTGFNLFAALLLLPFADTLEKLSLLIIRPEANRRHKKNISHPSLFCGILSALRDNHR